MRNMLRAPQVVARQQLPEKVVAWLKSDSGRSAIHTAISEAESDIDALAQDRKVELERLNTPITL